MTNDQNSTTAKRLKIGVVFMPAILRFFLLFALASVTLFRVEDENKREIKYALAALGITSHYWIDIPIYELATR